MIDMSGVIVAKSDQINAPDLTNKPRTIKIAGVRLTGQEQATEIKIVGEDKVWRPCKSMVRVMARAWGIDGEKWKGESATLYCDPAVKFGKVQPGGIRISHLSGIRGTLTVCLQARKGVLVNYEIEPLPTQRTNTPAAATPQAAAADPSTDAGQSTGAASTDRIAAYCATVMDAISAAETTADLDAIEGKAATKLANHADQLAGIRTAVEFKRAFLAAQGDGFGGEAA